MICPECNGTGWFVDKKSWHNHYLGIEESFWKGSICTTCMGAGFVEDETP